MIYIKELNERDKEKEYQVLYHPPIHHEDETEYYTRIRKGN